jgi:hypothetical protein
MKTTRMDCIQIQVGDIPPLWRPRAAGAAPTPNRAPVDPGVTL